MKKIRIAYIKFGGLSAGGTERWLQVMAANLPKNQFDIDFYYCDAAPYIGSDYRHADTDPLRLQYMRDHGVNLIKFHVGAKDLRVPTHNWVDTNFWEIFDSSKYDLVQTAKAGHPEYPYYKIPLPVVEFVALGAGVDNTSNIAISIHLSQWQRAKWFREGGCLKKSEVIPIPAAEPASIDSLRKELNIPASALVAGFHQRADENIFSPVPLEAFARINQHDRHFILMGGAEAYRQQALQLGVKNVHFLPHSSDEIQISKFLNTLDIFAHGRKDGETFGTVFAEAMMHGKPCLSHRSEVANAQPETMGPGGMFAENQIEYEHKLNLLFSDAKLRKYLGDKGRQHAQNYYSVDACIVKLISIYKAVYLRLEDFQNNSLSNLSLPYGITDMGFLYSGNVHKSPEIAYCVMTGGCPEEFCVSVMRYFLPQTKTLIDVGGNIGLYCWIAAKESDAQIYVFEPQADCIKFLKKTVELNNWEDRVSIHHLALGDKQGIANLHLSGTGSTLDNDFNDNANLPIETVAVDTLDHQMELLGYPKVDFLKIDVEGFEQMVLNGSTQVLLQDRPILFIEIADKVRGRKYINKHYNETLEFIESYDYVILRANDATLSMEHVTANKGNGFDHIAMYLCVPKDEWPLHEKKLIQYLEKFKREKRSLRVRLRIKRIKRLLKSSTDRLLRYFLRWISGVR